MNQIIFKNFKPLYYKIYQIEALVFYLIKKIKLKKYTSNIISKRNEEYGL